MLLLKVLFLKKINKLIKNNIGMKIIRFSILLIIFFLINKSAYAYGLCPPTCNSGWNCSLNQECVLYDGGEFCGITDRYCAECGDLVGYTCYGWDYDNEVLYEGECSGTTSDCEQEPLLANGESCSTGSECVSGYCVDGVCCENACDSQCKRCNSYGNCVNEADGYNDCGSGCQRCVSGSCQDYNAACSEVTCPADTCNGDYTGILDYPDSCQRQCSNGLCLDCCTSTLVSCSAGEICVNAKCINKDQSITYLSNGVLGLADESTVLYLNFDTTNSNADASRYSNGFVVYGGPVYSSNEGYGRSGVYDFDGNDDYIKVPDSSILNLSSFTVSVWFKYEGEGIRDRNYYTILNKNSGGHGYLDMYHLWVTKSASNNNVFQARVGDGVSSEHVLTSGVNVNDERWHNGVLTLDSSTMKYSLYLDGVLKDSYTASWSARANNDPLIIGEWSAYNNNFNGKIDEVRILDRALSPDEVKRLYEGKSISLKYGKNSPGLIGYWSMDEGTGSRVEDLSPYQYSAVFAIYPSWTLDSKSGYALDFDGVDDYIYVPSNPSLYNVDVGDVRSFSMWFKAGPQTGHDGYILWKEGSCIGWRFYLQTDGDIRFLFNTGTGCTSYSSHLIEAVGSYDDNEWHHIFGIIDRVNNIMKLYVDGNLIGSKTVNTNPGAGGSFRIGTNWDNSNPFDGIIDEVKIWNRALSESEILDEYERNSQDLSWSDDEKGLLAYYSFEHADAVHIKDMSTNNNDAIAYGDNVYEKGVHGMGLSLDAYNNWVNIGDLGNPSAMTLSFWFKTTDFNNGGDYLFDNRENGGTWWLLQDYVSGACTDGNGNICFEGRAEIPSTYLSSNTWYHVVVVDDSLASKLYLNGNLIDTGTGEDPNLANVRIGTRYSNSGYFDGVIDEVRIYNRVLSADEVTKLYEEGKRVIEVSSSYNGDDYERVIPNNNCMILTIDDNGESYDHISDYFESIGCEVINDNNVDTLAEVEAYNPDIIIGDRYVWSLTKSSFFNTLYDNGYSIITTANDQGSAIYPITSRTSTGGSVDWDLIVTNGYHALTRDWVLHSAGTDGGYYPTGIHSSATQLAKITGTNYAGAIYLHEPGKGKWLHLQTKATSSTGRDTLLNNTLFMFLPEIMEFVDYKKKDITPPVFTSSPSITYNNPTSITISWNAEDAGTLYKALATQISSEGVKGITDTFDSYTDGTKVDDTSGWDEADETNNCESGSTTDCWVWNNGVLDGSNIANNDYGQWLTTPYTVPANTDFIFSIRLKSVPLATPYIRLAGHQIYITYNSGLSQQYLKLVRLSDNKLLSSATISPWETDVWRTLVVEVTNDDITAKLYSKDGSKMYVVSGTNTVGTAGTIKLNTEHETLYDNLSLILMKKKTITSGLKTNPYYVDEITGGSGASDSGWISSNSYTDSGLDCFTQYTYQVKALDNQGNQVVSNSLTFYPIDGQTCISGGGNEGYCITSEKCYYEGNCDGIERGTYSGAYYCGETGDNNIYYCGVDSKTYTVDKSDWESVMIGKNSCGAVTCYNHNWDNIIKDGDSYSYVDTTSTLGSGINSGNINIGSGCDSFIIMSDVDLTLKGFNITFMGSNQNLILKSRSSLFLEDESQILGG